MKLVLKQPFYIVFPLCCVNHTSDLQGIPSCNGAMESPKLGLRFSWKGSAKDQVQEWHPLKVVIEFSTARNQHVAANRRPGKQWLGGDERR